MKSLNRVYCPNHSGSRANPETGVCWLCYQTQANKKLPPRPKREPKDGLGWGRAQVQRRRQKVRELLAQGWTVPQIANHLDVNKHNVWADARVLGIRIAKREYTASPELIERMNALFDDGLSREAVAQTVGKPVKFVAKWCPGRCWEPRRKPRTKEPDHE